MRYNSAPVAYSTSNNGTSTSTNAVNSSRGYGTYGTHPCDGGCGCQKPRTYSKVPPCGNPPITCGCPHNNDTVYQNSTQALYRGDRWWGA